MEFKRLPSIGCNMKLYNSSSPFWNGTKFLCHPRSYPFKLVMIHTFFKKTPPLEFIYQFLASFLLQAMQQNFRAQQGSCLPPGSGRSMIIGTVQ